ncbi:unnamed protein product [Merluccius merluccius]
MSVKQEKTRDQGFQQELVEHEEEGRRQGKTETQINAEYFRRITAMFNEADVDGGGGLDMDEFRVSMKKIMAHVDDEDIDIIFMKVDTNCDGTVDLDEYMNYMMLECTQKDSLQNMDRLYFPKPFQLLPVSTASTVPIVGIQFVPSQRRQSSTKSSTQPEGMYLTLRRDGILSYWNGDFKQTHTVDLCQLRPSHNSSFSGKIHVTDMVCLTDLHQIAVASTSRHLDFYKIHTGRSCDYLYSLTALDSLVVAVHYWSNSTKAVFSVGDVDGCISVFISFNVNICGLFNRSSGAKTDVSFLMKNTSADHLCLKLSIHDEWCGQLQFLPQLNAMASCSRSDTTSLVITTIPHSPKARVSRTAFKIRRGVACFDFSPELERLGKFNIQHPHTHTSLVKSVSPPPCASLGGVVTGGVDGALKVWKPTQTTCTMSELEGHAVAITHVLLKGQHKKILSISTDKNVRLWDLVNSVCLQSITLRHLALGLSPFSSVFLSTHTSTLILATYQIGLLRVYVDDAAHRPNTSHEKPLCAALYNPYFKQVVSGCRGGVVCVWDVLNGEKVMQFQTSPEKPADEEDLDYRVWNQYHAEDICTLDSYGDTVLATACYHGDIIIWNAQSGRASCRFNASDGPRPLLPNRVFDSSSQGQSEKRAHQSPKVRDSEKCGKAASGVTEPDQETSEVHSAPSAASTTGAVGSTKTPGATQGGLLGRFEAVHSEGASISSMSTDDQDQTLLTGDSTGSIAVKADWTVAVAPPPLRSTWRAHVGRVVSATYLKRFQLILTAALDCNVRLWSVDGSYLGTFAVDQWSVKNPPAVPREPPQQLLH